MKRKIMCICVCAAGAAGCWGPVEMDRTEEESNEYVAMNNHIEFDGNFSLPDDGVKKSLYVTGVEYPDGTQWRGDVAFDIPGSSLILMKDGVKIVEVPVGSDNCVSVDADMHRCLDGHLYTDFSTDSETVIKKDGEEIFRYSGREMIISMILKDSHVFTLGVPRSGGEGWTFRRDGETLLSRSGGKLVGGLYEDGGSVVFSFMEEGGNFAGNSYYVVNNALAGAYSSIYGISDIDDMRLIDGTVSCVARMDGLLGAFLFTGQSYVALESSADYDLLGDMRIHYDGEDRLVTGSLGASGTGLWREGVLEAFVGGRIVGMTVSGSSYACLTATDGGGFDGIRIDGEIFAWPSGCDFLYGSCAALDGTDFVLGLVDGTDGGPALWRKGEVTPLGFNGVVTGVSFW